MKKQLFLKTVIQNPYILHKPTVKQAQFLLLDNREALYGGAAGGGKSEALFMGALQYITIPEYSAIIFRRTIKALYKPKALIDRSFEWLDGKDARWDGVHHTWHFPSGAQLTFGYLENDRDVYEHQSAEYHYIAFDELTQFTEFQYRYMMSRARRTQDSNIPIRIRSATNPPTLLDGKVYGTWVKQRFIIEGIENNRAFIPAKLDDNPFIDREDYLQQLSNLDPYTRETLLNGNWDMQPPSSLIKRAWIVGDKTRASNIIEPSEAPTDTLRVRVWDLASTPETVIGDPDYSVGTLATLKDGILYIIHVARTRGSPQQTELLVRQTANADGNTVPIYIEEEAGASGKIAIDHYMREVLLGFAVHAERPTGDKVVRASPLSSACEANRVKVVRGEWLNEWLDEVCSFPQSAHDDQVDTAAYAYNILSGVGRPPKIYHA